MIVALRQDLEVQNTGLVLNHWAVINVQHDLLNERVNLELIGYASKADRIAGKQPIPGAVYTTVIKNLPASYDSVTGEEVSAAQNHYTAFLRFKLTNEELALDPVVRHRHLLKGAVLDFLRNDAVFSLATEDE